MIRTRLRKTPTRQLVLAELLAADDAESGAEMYGWEIAQKTGLTSGTVAPMLTGLWQYGWLSWHWEKGDPVVLGRRLRKLYRLRRRAIPQIRAYVQS